MTQATTRNSDQNTENRICRVLGQDLNQQTPEVVRNLCAWANTPPHSRPAAVCPYRADIGMSGEKALCMKAKAVCSVLSPATNTNQPREIAICPSRLLSSNLTQIMPMLLDMQEPLLLSEVSVPSNNGGKAFQIDLILVDSNRKMVAIEVQAVYTTGGGLGDQLNALSQTGAIDPDGKTFGLDWRSSGAKRLLPQIDAEWEVLSKAAIRLCILAQANLFPMLPSDLPRASQIGERQFRDSLGPDKIIVAVVEEPGDPKSSHRPFEQITFVAATYQQVREALMAGTQTTPDLLLAAIERNIQKNTAQALHPLNASPLPEAR